MFILLCGTGVGFSVERQHVQKLPEVPDTLYESDDLLCVADSKEGWAKALRKLIAHLYAGEVPKWDIGKIRPAGAKLKTFGGRASGPGPLIDLFNFTVETFKGATGRKLSSLECHDLMCKIGEIVVVGGVRRSAMISLSNLSDDRMRHAKSGQFPAHRFLANNSVAYTEKPDAQAFLREWSSLADSGSGERGVFNRVASQKQAEKYGRRDPGYEFGTNPCCVSGETPILTRDGYFPIEDTVGKSVDIWNGEDWAEVEPYEAGVSSLIRVRLSDGSYLDCTPNHRWCVDGEFVETQNLSVGDKLDKFEMPVVHPPQTVTEDMEKAYSQGFYAGDGVRGLSHSYLYEPKYCVEEALVGECVADAPGRKRWKHGEMLQKSFVPVNGSLAYRLRWLAGLLDADGTVTRDANGNGFQIGSVDQEFLDQTRLMLTGMGVRPKIVNAKAAGRHLLPDGKGGNKEYECKEVKRILIGNYDAWKLMELGLSDHLRRLDHNGEMPQRDARRFTRVTDIKPLGITEMTYCFTEPKTSRGTFNGVVTGNSEIILRPYQFCNLTEVVVRAPDTKKDLSRKVRLATILGTIQSSMTKFPYLRKIWQRNTEEERLLGVSMTGIMDNTLTNGKEGDLAALLEDLREEAVKTNKEWAEKLGIPQSAAITCVKPSGTVSQLVDSASGIHARHSEYYIRTVRGDNKDPLTQFMKDQGIPAEPCVYKGDTTTVFSFPIKSPEGAVTRTDMTAIEQLEMWLMYQRHWCEHKPSVTVSVKKDEWLEVGAYIYDYFDEMSGVSFLPFDDHVYQQAPYQDASKDEYDDLLAQMPGKIDWSRLKEYEAEDTTKSSQTLACSGDSCEIVDIGA